MPQCTQLSRRRECQLSLVFCLENPMDRGAWWATVHRITRVRHDLATKPPPPPPHNYQVVGEGGAGSGLFPTVQQMLQVMEKSYIIRNGLWSRVAPHQLVSPSLLRPQVLTSKMSKPKPYRSRDQEQEAMCVKILGQLQTLFKSKAFFFLN